MTDLHFHLVDEPADDNSDYDDTGCQCPPGNNQYLLEIEEGQVVLVHAACGKKPSYTWGDWQDLVYMNPIPVTVDWERDCDGSAWHGDHRCDCDSWVQVTATSVPEDVRAAALEQSRQQTTAKES